MYLNCLYKNKTDQIFTQSAQYFALVLFIMLYKVIVSFESVGKTPKFEHSNDGYQAVLSRGAVYYVVHSGCVQTLLEFIWVYKWEKMRILVQLWTWKSMRECNKAAGCLALLNTWLVFRHSPRHKAKAWISFLITVLSRTTCARTQSYSTYSWKTRRCVLFFISIYFFDGGGTRDQGIG